jgi:hypothetical protein
MGPRAAALVAGIIDLTEDRPRRERLVCPPC